MTKLKKSKYDKKCDKTKKSKYDKTQKLKMWQNSKTQNVTKLKNLKCDQT